MEKEFLVAYFKNVPMFSGNNYDIICGAYKKDWRKDYDGYVTSPEIRRGITKLRGASGQKQAKIGEVRYGIYNVARKGKKITSLGFHPSTRYDYRGHGIENPFIKIGFASMIEHELVKHLEKTFPKSNIRTTYCPEPKRFRQVKRQGRKPGISLPIGEAKARIKKYVVSEYRKRHPIKTFRAWAKRKFAR